MKNKNAGLNRPWPPAALAAAAALAGSAHAQSNVTLYGQVDAAVRISDHQGAGGNKKLTSLLGSGLTPSRIGWSITEDLGGGMRAMANLEYRFTLDNGNTEAGGQFWQQSYVGLQSSAWGRITLGRQYNVLFDTAGSTFAAFKSLGPFLNSYKPEIAVALGARNDNQVKYLLQAGPLTAELEVAAGEGAATTTTSLGKAYGGMLRYDFGPVAASGGYLERRDAADRKARAWALGAGYQAGPLYLNASAAANRFDDGLNTALLLVGSGAENTLAPNQPAVTPLLGAVHTRERRLWSVGGTYNVTPATTLGAQYWRMQQSYAIAHARDVSGNFLALLGDYAWSKRTDVYAALEYTRLDGLQLTDTASGVPNGQSRRAAAMLGLRHKF